MFELAIIIVNYKNDLKTIEYVNDELSKLSSVYLLVIINNAASDESNDLLCKELNCSLQYEANLYFENSKRFVISSNENLGFAKGNNLGATFAINFFAVKYLLFSNNDIRILQAESTNLLIEKMSENLDIGLIGPNCLDINGDSQSPRPYRSFFSKYIYTYWITFFISKRRKIELMEFDYALKAKEGYHYKLSGSFLLARAADFVKCGMMDPATFLYCEEEILTERMYKINKKAYYFPDVKVIHEHNQTVGKFINNKKKMELDFNSNAYYYKTYKKVNRFSIFLGKINHYFFFYLKVWFRKEI